MSDPKDTHDGDDYSDYLEDAQAPETDADITAEEAVVEAPKQKTSKSGLGWGSALTLFLLSSVMGAAGGFAAVHYLKPAPAVSKPVDISPLRARVDTAEKRLSGQAAQLSLLQTEINNRPASVSVKAAPMGSTGTEVIENTQNTQAITDLQSQISTMETALADLRRDLETGLPGESGLSDETRSSERPIANAEDAAPDAIAVSDPRIEALQEDITTLRSRIETLEGGLSETRALASQPTIVTQPLLLPAFPRDAVFEALTQDPEARDAGWISKTLKKHISVRNPEDVKAAEKDLSNISDAIEAGDIKRALSILETMPEAAQLAAKNWMTAASKSQ